MEKTGNISIEHKFLHVKIPKSSDVKVGDFYAVFWDKPYMYYCGKVLKILRDAGDVDITEAEITFLLCCI